MAYLALKLIGFYQTWISPLLPPHCRFYPTCSSYTQEAIQRFGFTKGFYLGVKRLLKCHPWHPGGVDLVPDECACHADKPLKLPQNK